MIEQIKNLRIEIECNINAISSISSKQKYIIDIAKIPKDLGWTLEQYLEVFERTNFAIVDSSEYPQLEGIDFNSFVIPIPFEAKELNKAANSLYLAQSYLGKILENNNEDITIPRYVTGWAKKLSYSEKVEALKIETNELIKTITDITTEDIVTKEYLKQASNYLLECVFWLNKDLKNKNN
jgi:hypothetical protein